jgi:hypothetical protein
MADNIFRHIFANAVTAALLRAKALGRDDQRELARSIAVGFGLTESQGDSIYTSFLEDAQDVNGFADGTFYDSYEESVRDILVGDSRTSSLTSGQIDVLTLVAHAIIFGYAMNPNIEAGLLNNVIGRSLNETGTRVFSFAPYTQNEQEQYLQPFSRVVIYSLLAANNYSQIISQISSSPANSEVELVNYNWYDTTKLFSGPNLDLMKDSENQYYYLSGQLLYPEIPMDFKFCEEVSIPINTPTGTIVSSFFTNAPCIDRASYVGPVTGIKFYRVFNDGPYSSGDFTDEVKEAFISFDKQFLSGEQYSGNKAPFYSYVTNSSGQYVTVYNKDQSYDIVGEYDLSQEYKYAPMSTGCFPKYQVMRVGDARLRSQCIKFDKGVCIECDELPTTGFKFALLELNPKLWSGNYDYVRTNPPTPQLRILKRALNYNSSAYKSTESVGQLQTYTLDEFSNPVWYVGPPQLAGDDVLPFFAFTEAFSSSVFDSGAKVLLYPAYGSSNGSTRSYTIGKPVASGEDLTEYTVRKGVEDNAFPRAKFYQIIPSFTKEDDEPKLKLFGMGNAFSGSFSTAAILQYNAGYVYSGYTSTGGDSLSDLENRYSSYKVGSSIKNVKYISGYTGENEIPVNKVYGHDNNKHNHEYYFFDERLVPKSVTITNYTGWERFAPLPSGLEGNPNYERGYDVQANENYFPRYYKGPYAKNVRKFMYPNADAVSKVFSGQGFPNKLKYKIEVREEAVKEIYATYSMINGQIYGPNLINALRADGTYGVIQEPFDCLTCDFNQWALSGAEIFATSPTNLVDNYYSNAPYSGRNNVVYNAAPTFKQGILLTGINATLFYNYTYFCPDAECNGGVLTTTTTHYNVTPVGVGLFHYYEGYEITGNLLYTKPAFSLEKNSVDTSLAISALPIVSGGCYSYFYCDGGCTPSLSTGLVGLLTKSRDGRLFYSLSGLDPIYYEFLGGRSGQNAENEGGYHSKGLIGDSWLGHSFQDFGYLCTTFQCSDLPYTGLPVDVATASTRVPENDNLWFLTSLTPNKTTIFTRGLKFNPMIFSGAPNEFSLSSPNPVISGFSVPIGYNQDLNAFYFDLGACAPFKTTRGSGEWYFTPTGSGIIVGPFDRDVELFAHNSWPISGSTNMFVNGVMVTDAINGSIGGCSMPNVISGVSETLPANSAYNITFNNIKVFAYIRSGEKANINVQNNLSSGDETSVIGFPTNTFLHIRARTYQNETNFSSDQQKYLNLYGSADWTNRFKLINNGLEGMFELNHSGFDDLVGKSYTFITAVRTGKLYSARNIPTETVTTEVKTPIEFGYTGWDTSVYPYTKFLITNHTQPNIEEYYRTISEGDINTVYTFSLWREASRISFKFTQLESEFGVFPYESHSQIIPSGNCILSGEMGYYGQADNAIFSEGFYLKDMTVGDKIKENLYGPEYVSPILQRVPYFSYPSGTFSHPVLEAPSIMRQRRDRFNITYDQEYSGINNEAPYNYNKLLWPALSDLKTLNDEESLEDLPPDDGNTFLNSSLLISAAQGQKLPNGRFNPNTKKLYVVKSQYQTYDSIATDALINYKYFITSGYGFQTSLEQPNEGKLVPLGSTLTDILSGLV